MRGVQIQTMPFDNHNFRQPVALRAFSFQALQRLEKPVRPPKGSYLTSPRSAFSPPHQDNLHAKNYRSFVDSKIGVGDEKTEKEAHRQRAAEALRRTTGISSKLAGENHATPQIEIQSIIPQMWGSSAPISPGHGSPTARIEKRVVVPHSPPILTSTTLSQNQSRVQQNFEVTGSFSLQDTPERKMCKTPIRNKKTSNWQKRMACYKRTACSTPLSKKDARDTPKRQWKHAQNIQLSIGQMNTLPDFSKNNALRPTLRPKSSKKRSIEKPVLKCLLHTDWMKTAPAIKLSSNEIIKRQTPVVRPKSQMVKLRQTPVRPIHSRPGSAYKLRQYTQPLTDSPLSASPHKSADLRHLLQSFITHYPEGIRTARVKLSERPKKLKLSGDEHVEFSNELINGARRGILINNKIQ